MDIDYTDRQSILKYCVEICSFRAVEMSVLKVVIFCVCVVVSVKSWPTTERSNWSQYGSLETNEIEDKEYKGNSAFRRSPYDEKEFFVFDNKRNWVEARDACLDQGMLLATPESDIQLLKLRDYIRDNGLVPADKFSGYWVGGKRDNNEAPFIWQHTGTRVPFYSWLPGEPNDFTGEDCIEFKNDGDSLGLNNLYCESARGYICEKALPQESLKNNEFEESNLIHEETMKYIFQKMLQHIQSFEGSDSDETDTVSAASATDKSDLDLDSSTTNEEIEFASSTAKAILDEWGTMPEQSSPLPIPYDDYYSSYDDDY